MDILDKIKHLWKKSKFPCMICDGDDWLVAEDIMEIRLTKLHSYDGWSIPSVIITCNTCGNTIILNAKKAGLINENGDIVDIETDE